MISLEDRVRGHKTRRLNQLENIIALNDDEQLDIKQLKIVADAIVKNHDKIDFAVLKKGDKKMEEVKKMKISDKETIEEIKSLQRYIRSKGEEATHTEIIRACIHLANRLSAEDWGVYLEVKSMHKLKDIENG